MLKDIEKRDNSVEARQLRLRRRYVRQLRNLFAQTKSVFAGLQESITNEPFGLTQAEVVEAFGEDWDELVTLNQRVADVLTSIFDGFESGKGI